MQITVNKHQRHSDTIAWIHFFFLATDLLDTAAAGAGSSRSVPFLFDAPVPEASASAASSFFGLRFLAAEALLELCLGDSRVPVATGPGADLSSTWSRPTELATFSPPEPAPAAVLVDSAG